MGKILVVLLAVITVAVAGVSTVNWVSSLDMGDMAGQPSPTESPVIIPSPVSPSPVTAPSPTPLSTEVEPESEPAPELDFAAKLDLLKSAVSEVCAGGGSRELTLTFTEAEANEQAAAYLGIYNVTEEISLEVRDAAIDFRDGNEVYGVFKTKLAFVTTDVKVRAGVKLIDGELVVTLEKVSFGFLPLPDVVKDQVITLVEQKIAALKESYLGTDAACPAAAKLEFTRLVITADTASFTVLISGEAGLP